MRFLSELWRRLGGNRSLSSRGDKAEQAPVDPDPTFITAQGGAEIERFVVTRQAVLDRNMAVVGYEFAQAGGKPSATDEFEHDRILLRYVRSEEARKLVGDRIAFVTISAKLLFDGMIDELAGSNTVPLIRPALMHHVDPLQIDRIAALKRAGVTVGTADGHAVLKDEALADAVGAVFFSIGEFLPPDLLQLSRDLSKRHPALKLGIRGLETQEEFDACARLSFVYFHGPFIRRREEWSPNQASPSALRICDLLARLRQGAELEEIAEQIRLDPMISFRILRVANSAAIGATRDITTPREACLIIGKDALYRWLALLLCATAPDAPSRQVVLEIALARGRLMELLAAPDADAARRQLLFLTGMFSLLDVILKVPMETLLAQVKMPPELVEAVVRHGGPCAPALELALAGERADEAAIRELCAKAGIELAAFNRAQADAWAWASESAQGLQAPA